MTPHTKRPNAMSRHDKWQAFISTSGMFVAANAQAKLQANSIGCERSELHWLACLLQRMLGSSDARIASYADFSRVNDAV